MNFPRQAISQNFSCSNEKGSLVSDYIILNEEKRVALTEILQCAVCFDIPIGKQVLICQQGHHFCSSCHAQLKYCGLCRGTLLQGRNFAVEELIKLFNDLISIPKHNMGSPVELPSGVFKCQHNCEAKLFAFKMLSHIRNKHSDNLIDNVQTNSITGKFSWAYQIALEPKATYALSVQISNIGLCTVLIKSGEIDLFSCIKILGKKTAASSIKYELVLKAPSKHNLNSFFEFGLKDSNVVCYDEDIYSAGNCLKIRGTTLSELIDYSRPIIIVFSIWKDIIQIAANRYFEIPTVTLSKLSFYANDRKTQRNRKRNKRRKRIKEKDLDLPRKEAPFFQNVS